MLKKLGLVILLVSLGTGTAAWAQHGKQNFHSTVPGHKVDYAELIAKATDLTDSPAGQAVLQECLQAYGGIEKLMTLDRARIVYDHVTNQSADPVEVVKTFQRGRQYRTVKGVDSRLINDLTCWYEHEDQVAELDNTRYRTELFSYLTLSMPLAAKTERFDMVRYGKVEGDPLEYLYFDKTDSLTIILGIDPQSHLIHKSTGIIPQGPQNFIYINEFSDFKTHEGFVFPGMVTFYSLGMRVGQSVVREVQINPNFETNEFRPRNKLD